MLGYLSQGNRRDRGRFPERGVAVLQEVGILSEEETSLGLEMVDDRNLTSHTYNEGLAVSIYVRLDQYAKLLGCWLERMKKQSEEIAGQGKLN